MGTTELTPPRPALPTDRRGKEYEYEYLPGYPLGSTQRRVGRMFSPIKYVQSALGKLFTPSPAGKTKSGKKGRGRPRGGVSKPRKRKQHIKSDLKKPKRPTSAYVVFATEVRKSVVEKDPSLKPTEVTKVIGERWRACKPEDRKQYEKEAAVDR